MLWAGPVAHVCCCYCCFDAVTEIATAAYGPTTAATGTVSACDAVTAATNSIGTVVFAAAFTVAAYGGIGGATVAVIDGGLLRPLLLLLSFSLLC